MSDERLDLSLVLKVILEDDVMVAERVTILPHTNVGYASHPLQKYFPPSSAPVRLERGVFVGVNATLLPGITIGECVSIAAGSVVAENAPALTLVGGVPARVIRQLVTRV